MTDMPTERAASDWRSQLAHVLQQPRVRLLCGMGALLFAISLLGLGATPVAVGVANPPWDKLLHLMAYATVAGLIALGLGGRRPGMTIALALTLARIDEGLQHFEPGRNADLADLMTDAVAAILASSLCAWLTQPAHAQA